jgi:uncharacterized protein (DUF2147 family)
MFTPTRLAKTDEQEAGINRQRIIFPPLIVGIAAALLFQACAKPAASFDALAGRWERPDGGYVLEIKSVTADGAMDAAYFNPRPIHVGQARAVSESQQLHVLIELQDVNYPGSTYKLTFDPATDQLKGTYYQAVIKQTYPVFFVRLKS